MKKYFYKGAVRFAVGKIDLDSSATVKSRILLLLTVLLTIIIHPREVRTTNFDIRTLSSSTTTTKKTNGGGKTINGLVLDKFTCHQRNGEKATTSSINVLTNFHDLDDTSRPQGQTRKNDINNDDKSTTKTIRMIQVPTGSWHFPPANFPLLSTCWSRLVRQTSGGRLPAALITSSTTLTPDNQRKSRGNKRENSFQRLTLIGGRAASLYASFVGGKGRGEAAMTPRSDETKKPQISSSFSYLVLRGETDKRCVRKALGPIRNQLRQRWDEQKTEQQGRRTPDDRNPVQPKSFYLLVYEPKLAAGLSKMAAADPRRLAAAGKNDDQLLIGSAVRKWTKLNNRRSIRIRLVFLQEPLYDLVQDHPKKGNRRQHQNESLTEHMEMTKDHRICELRVLRSTNGGQLKNGENAWLTFNGTQQISALIFLFLMMALLCICTFMCGCTKKGEGILGENSTVPVQMLTNIASTVVTYEEAEIGVDKIIGLQQIGFRNEMKTKRTTSARNYHLLLSTSPNAISPDTTAGTSLQTTTNSPSSPIQAIAIRQFSNSTTTTTTAYDSPPRISMAIL